MSCYANITGDERIYFYYDTSGSIGNADLASLRAAVAGIIPLLVVAGIDPDNISEVNSTNERYLTWFNQSATNYLVVAFINEANPSYHGETTDTGPTAQWTSDYGSFKSHIAARTFRGLIYALDVGEPQYANLVRTFNEQHAPHAVNGSHGYPSGADSLLSLGVRLRASVPIGRSAAEYARDILDFLAGWQGGGFCERIRATVNEDAGSIFQAVQALAVDAGISEAYPYGVKLRPAVLHPFREALTPEETAFRYYPLATRNTEALATYEGETSLGRMARTYPAPIMTRVADIPGHSGQTMTAQQAIQHVFDRWSNEFEWFRPLPVPDLRLLVGEAVADPRQYYVDNPGVGVLTTEAIVIPQDGDNRRTMREIVDEWLSIFPGTIIRQNAAGYVELVPRVGPDAPAEALTLEWRDILSISDGEDDPRGVINRARVTSQGWEWQEDQAVVPPLYVLATRSDGLKAEAMEEVTDDLNAEPLANGAEREFEVFVEPDTPLDVDLTFSAWSASNSSGTGGLTEEVNLSISFTVALGQTRIVEFSWYMFGVDNEKTFAHVTRTERGLKVRVVGDRYRFGPNPFAGIRYVAYLLEVTATGTAWTRSNEAVTAEFSLANGDFVPGPDGTNALETSTELYGEREATIRSDVFQLTPEQALAVAQGHVLFNINPRTIRDVRQSEWNKFPVKFDHVGRLVDLPNGERAVIENRSYSDSFAPSGGFMQSTFTATVSEIVIDTTTEYLYFDSGDYMRLDDGNLVEIS